MTIAHETLIGENGEPKAAVIPWDIFLAIQEQLQSPEDEQIEDTWKAEVSSRVQEIDTGKVTLKEHDEVMNRVRSSLSQVR